MSVPIGTPLKHRKAASASSLPSQWLWAGLLVGLGVTGWWGYRRFAAPPPAALPGYVESAVKLRDEYSRAQGQQLRNEGLVRQFAEASQLARSGQFADAITILESLSREAPVPAIFNNLGVLYRRIHDPARAVNAFREALARDSGYQAARINLDAMGEMRPGSPVPVTHEVEPNNTRLLANVVPLGAPVEAAIDSGNDSDYYRVSAPPPPRDLLEIRVENRSQTLAPGLIVQDVNGVRLGRSNERPEVGSIVVQTLSPLPNGIIYLYVWGQRATQGAYVLTVRPQKAFDLYEPNDDLFNAHQLPIGQSIEANIMDEQDTDYFQFEAPRTGKVQIEIANQSPLLIPAISLYTSDKHFSGFGPDIRTPGSGLTYAMEVEAGKAYFVQVWSQGSTRGSYRLNVKWT